MHAWHNQSEVIYWKTCDVIWYHSNVWVNTLEVPLQRFEGAEAEVHTVVTIVYTNSYDTMALPLCKLSFTLCIFMGLVVIIAHRHGNNARICEKYEPLSAPVGCHGLQFLQVAVAPEQSGMAC
jgi:hypothetical protein